MRSSRWRRRRNTSAIAFPEGMVGTGGAETWRLFAFRPGAQRVSFEYRRPWERETAPARTISFATEVRQ